MNKSDAGEASMRTVLGSGERIIRVRIGDEVRPVNLDSTGDIERIINYLAGSVEELRADVRRLTVDG